MSRKDFHYAVVGSWPFPLDMLRRDRSVAATAEDQAKIDRLSQEAAPDLQAIRQKVKINLVIRDAGRWEKPLTARWESFGWTVPDDEERKLLAEERLRVERLGRLRDAALAKLTPEEINALRWFGPHALKHPVESH